MDNWLDMTDPDRPQTSRLRTALLKVVLPLMVIGGTITAILILHFDGTLRLFLDRQTPGGMIAVVLVVNIVGFAFIYMLSVVWKTIKYDLLHYQDH